jgi:adenosylmethionine-8-amino-7-oxononanoate aminotransferase
VLVPPLAVSTKDLRRLVDVTSRAIERTVERLA